MTQLQTTNLQTTIFSEIDHQFEDIVKLRRHLHEHPEKSFEEIETAKWITEQLHAIGLQVQSNIGGNGVIGILKGAQEGKTIALRADFDALPIDDAKDVPYKSKVKGVMHACGHDGHTAALLGTARVLSKYREQIKGTIIFLFQHAEELPPGGAKSIIESGVLDQVDYFFGAHLASGLPLGTVAVGEGHRMAAVDKFELIIEGKGGHGARPHETIDSIVIGSDVVQSLQKIVSRRVNPLHSAVVTVGVFQAGEAFNIIADSAKIAGTVRTFDDGIRKLVEDEIRTIIDGVTKAYHADYTLDYLNGYPSLYNHEEETALARKLFNDVFDQKNVVEFETSMGAEDFAYYLREKPGTYFQVGSRTEDQATQFPHHHPNFDFDERALTNIQKAFVTLISHYSF